MSTTGLQLLNQIFDGVNDLERMSLSELRKVARYLSISVSDGKRYLNRDDLITAIRAAL